MTIRCTCGQTLTSPEAICENCLTPAQKRAQDTCYEAPRRASSREEFTEAFNDLEMCATSLELYGPEMFPPPEDGKEHFGAVMVSSAAQAIRRLLMAIEPNEPECLLKVRGIGRIAEEKRALLVSLTDVPTDIEIGSLHEYLRGWKPWA